MIQAIAILLSLLLFAALYWGLTREQRRRREWLKKAIGRYL